MINIKVLSEFAEVTYNLPNSEKRQTKIMGLSEIPALFDTKISFDSGILPLFGKENAYGIQRIIQRDQDYTVLVQAINPYVNTLHEDKTKFEKDKLTKLGIAHFPIEYQDDVIYYRDESEAYCHESIYYPNLLLSLHLKKDSKGMMRIDKSGLLAYKDGFITDDTQLYAFPFSNTHNGSTYGQICWGHQSAPRITGLAQSVGIIHSFLGAIMNRDLYQPLTVHGQTLQTSSELLTYMAIRSSELSRFPYEDISLTKVIKYRDLVSYVNQNWK